MPDQPGFRPWDTEGCGLGETCKLRPRTSMAYPIGVLAG